jgi:methylenetetrahydrofolate dehydrogenase (NADP+)/methenyltetrahydrofolate cyclohydrolase
MILDGRKIKESRINQLKELVNSLENKPKLAIIQIGNLRESEIYVGQKVKFGERIGTPVEVFKFENDVTDEILISKISELNEDNEVKGIIVQLPVPEGLDLQKIINSIDPSKDVDGLTKVNTEKLENNQKGIVPATARGVLTLLNKNDVDVSGKKVLVIGRSNLVGRPTALLMENNGATVSVAHSKTEDLKKEVGEAEIVIVAVGKPNLITEDMINQNQVIIDVGINTTDNGMVGDTDFLNIKDKAKAISPVPGGVGQMTVLSLFENLLEA